MNKTLDLGLVGFGARAVALAQVVRGANISAVCDPDQAVHWAARAEFPKAVVTDSLAELLATQPDAVMISTPDDSHAEIAIQCLQAGVAVFLEKPLATRLEDADAVLRAAFESKSRLYVGHNMRHMPAITLLRQLILDGRIGEVKTIWCRHFVGHGVDYYFKDWHADRRRTTGLLLQKAAHDIDIIHWLAGAYSCRVSAMGDLMLFGDITNRRARNGERMTDWFSLDNWPPGAQTGLNPVIDVEDVSLVNLRLDNGVLASYQQCHFTPDYWRNYTIIGTEGRIENLGDTSGSTVALWNRRHDGAAEPDERFIVPELPGSTHDGADALLIAEFLRFVREGGPTETSPVAAREAVAAGVLATDSLRTDENVRSIPPLDPQLVAYFDGGQPR